MNGTLATTTASARLTGIPGRAITGVRGHHTVVDSPPPLGGPNEELNPLEVLLSALGTCAVFICETFAREREIELHEAEAWVEGDFDPRGVRSEGVNPRVQAFRLSLRLRGPSSEQAEAMMSAFKSRCPIYTTLVEAAPVDIRLVD